MCNCIQLWGFGMSYRTSVVAPVVATIVVIAIVLVAAAIVVLGFIAALLLAALVLRFIAVTATAAAAAVAASALVTAAAPAALDTATLEAQVDAPGAAGVVVEGVAREPQPLLYAVVLLPHMKPAVIHLAHLARRRRLLVRGSPISRRDDSHRNPLAVLL